MAWLIHSRPNAAASFRCVVLLCRLNRPDAAGEVATEARLHAARAGAFEELAISYCALATVARSEGRTASARQYRQLALKYALSQEAGAYDRAKRRAKNGTGWNTFFSAN
jgi:hypothetical protein